MFGDSIQVNQSEDDSFSTNIPQSNTGIVTLEKTIQKLKQRTQWKIHVISIIIFQTRQWKFVCFVPSVLFWHTKSLFYYEMNFIFLGWNIIISLDILFSSVMIDISIGSYGSDHVFINGILIL